MTQVLVVFLVMLALVAAMSVGVIFGRKPIAGTCGGLNNMFGQDPNEGCKICGGDPGLCDSTDEDAEEAAAKLAAMRPRAYDAASGRD